jgi:muramoyltetrapeptide carboxypeptidase
MIQPDYLKTGDAIIIIATARKISELEINPVVDFLNSKGFKVLLGPNLFKEHHQYAGTDAERNSDLQWALNHPEAKAIFIARGGYGTVRAVQNIDFEKFIQNPKWLVGYSDVTVLHHMIHQLGIQTLHATMPINFFKNDEARNSLIDALQGQYISLNAPHHQLNRLGEVKAPIVGGNLSLIYALSGTTVDINTRDKILFIEDLDEYLYHIDRMMMQLKLSGKLAHLKGLIVGGMTDMKDNPIPFGKTAEEIIMDAVSEYDYPVCFNLPAGHIDENMALFFGREIDLNVNSIKTEITF